VRYSAAVCRQSEQGNLLATGAGDGSVFAGSDQAFGYGSTDRLVTGQPVHALVILPEELHQTVKRLMRCGRSIKLVNWDEQ
jgi:hypothetical protein